MGRKKGQPALAKRYPLPQKSLLSIEYPGHVNNVENAIKSIGGREKLARDISEDLGAHIELRYRYNDPTSQPINGEIVPTQNLLIKVTRQTRKIKGVTDKNASETTKTSAEVVGLVEKTVRFRKLADFQYMVPKGDPLLKLHSALHDININEIVELASGDFFEKTIPSNMSYIPAPFFDPKGWPSQFNILSEHAEYKNAHENTNMQDEEDVEVYRKKSKSYKSDYSIISIKFTDQGPVPTEPTPEAIKDIDQIPKELISRVKNILDETPVVGRNVMDGLIPAAERAGFRIPVVACMMSYIMETGPWRSCWIRFGYDPRTDPESYKYQILDQRKLGALAPAGKKLADLKKENALQQSQTDQRLQKPLGSREIERVVFDQDAARQGIAGKFQFMNIKLPLIQELIEYPPGRRDTPCELTGWLYPSVVNTIRTKIRVLRKYYEDGAEEEPKDLDIDYEELDQLIANDRREEEAEKSALQMIRDRDESTLLGVSSQVVHDRVNARVDEFMRELGTQQNRGGLDPENAEALGDMLDWEAEEFDIYGEDESEDGFDDI